jgi:hypothetical protein
MQVRKSARFLAPISLLALAACSGGGGGAALNTTTSPPSSTTPQTVVVFSGGSSVSDAATPVLATGATPNFTTNPPSVGTSFPLIMTGLSIKRVNGANAIPPNSITVAAVSPLDATETYEGRFTTAGGTTYPLLGLNIPALNIHAIGLKGDGTSATQFDGSKVAAIATGLNYLLMGAWTYQAANGNDAAFGMTVAGYQTPAANVPTTGTATYIGSGASGATAGGVVGTVIMKSGSDNIASATLRGNVNINVDFAAQTANGTLTNMTAKDVTSGATSPWNDVSLTGKFYATSAPTAGGAGAYMNGTAQAQAAPAGATLGMPSSAHGFLSGAPFGPNADEMGGVWTLTSDGGKAMGIFGATRQ